MEQADSSACLVLHREVKTHGDLCPEHIEFLDSFCVTEESYNEQTKQYESEVRHRSHKETRNA